ncbi:MAG: DUF4268 domain-containing protein [Bacteroidales bacterium]|nr:DUF4268 domain-containing protein [Bacteroidales bacterium]
MYPKEEKKILREAFWNSFKVYSNKRKIREGKPGKWIMNQTGIKGLSLKFHFDENYAWAGYEISSSSLDKQINLFDKLEKLKTILEKSVPVDLEWELETQIDNNVKVSRVGARKENVNIYNKQHWKAVNLFLYSVMVPIEGVFRDYYDFIKYQ